LRGYLPVMVKNLNNFLQHSYLTQEEFAKLCGVQQPTVSRWLNGKIRIAADRCARVSKVTGIPVNELRPDVQWITDTAWVVSSVPPNCEETAA